MRNHDGYNSMRDRLADSPVRLTPREQDIAIQVARGLTNREIALTAGIAEQSVKNLVSKILDRTKTTNRVQLTLFVRGIDPSTD